MRHCGRAIASGIPGRPAPDAHIGASRRAVAIGRCGSDGERIEQVVAHHRAADRASRSGCRRGSTCEQRDIVEQLLARRSSAARARSSSERRARSAARGVMPFSCDGCEAPLQMHEQQRDRRRRDPGNARRLAEGFGPMLVELLLHFDRQPAHLRGSRDPPAAAGLRSRRGARLLRAGARCSPRTSPESPPARRLRRARGTAALGAMTLGIM